jgi:beta-phosphoglucomutase family hydrolase
MRTAPSSFTPPTEVFAGYIFDCDGTLADTMPLHHLAWQRALAEHGAEFDFHWELFVSRAGMTLEQTVVELAAQFRVPLDPTAVARSQRHFYAELEPTMEPIADVISYARSAARSAPVSVASGSQRATVDRTLCQLGISDLFPIIVTPEDVPRGKPAPDMFLLAARLMGVAPERCVVFEDGEMGIRAARSAGMAVVRVEAPRPRELAVSEG